MNSLIVIVTNSIALICAILTFVYVIKIYNTIKNHAFFLLIIAFGYAIISRTIILINSTIGKETITANIASLMSFFWILLAFAFYYCYKQIKTILKK